METFAIVLYITLFSGGFRNLERGVQSLAREAHPKIFWLPCPLLVMLAVRTEYLEPTPNIW